MWSDHLFQCSYELSMNERTNHRSLWSTAHSMQETSVAGDTQGRAVARPRRRKKLQFEQAPIKKNARTYTQEEKFVRNYICPSLFICAFKYVFVHEDVDYRCWICFYFIFFSFLFFGLTPNRDRACISVLVLLYIILLRFLIYHFGFFGYFLVFLFNYHCCYYLKCKFLVAVSNSAHCYAAGPFRLVGMNSVSPFLLWAYECGALLRLTKLGHQVFFFSLLSFFCGGDIATEIMMLCLTPLGREVCREDVRASSVMIVFFCASLCGAPKGPIAFPHFLSSLTAVTTNLFLLMHISPHRSYVRVVLHIHGWVPSYRNYSPPLTGSEVVALYQLEASPVRLSQTEVVFCISQGSPAFIQFIVFLLLFLGSLLAIRGSLSTTRRSARLTIVKAMEAVPHSTGSVSSAISQRELNRHNSATSPPLEFTWWHGVLIFLTAVALIAFIAVVVCCYLRRRERREDRSALSEMAVAGGMSPSGEWKDSRGIRYSYRRRRCHSSASPRSAVVAMEEPARDHRRPEADAATAPYYSEREDPSERCSEGKPGVVVATTQVWRGVRIANITRKTTEPSGGAPFAPYPFFFYQHYKRLCEENGGVELSPSDPPVEDEGNLACPPRSPSIYSAIFDLVSSGGPPSWEHTRRGALARDHHLLPAPRQYPVLRCGGVEKKNLLFLFYFFLFFRCHSRLKSFKGAFEDSAPYQYDSFFFLFLLSIYLFEHILFHFLLFCTLNIFFCGVGLQALVCCGSALEEVQVLVLPFLSSIHTLYINNNTNWREREREREVVDPIRRADTCLLRCLCVTYACSTPHLFDVPMNAAATAPSRHCSTGVPSPSFADLSLHVSCLPCSAPTHSKGIRMQLNADGDVASLRAAVAAELRLGECCGGSAPRLQLFVCPPGSSGEELVPVTSDALPLRALVAAVTGGMGGDSTATKLPSHCSGSVRAPRRSTRRTASALLVYYAIVYDGVDAAIFGSSIAYLLCLVAFLLFGSLFAVVHMIQARNRPPARGGVAGAASCAPSSGRCGGGGADPGGCRCRSSLRDQTAVQVQRHPVAAAAPLFSPGLYSGDAVGRVAESMRSSSRSRQAAASPPYRRGGPPARNPFDVYEGPRAAPGVVVPGAAPPRFVPCEAEGSDDPGSITSTILYGRAEYAAADGTSSTGRQPQLKNSSPARRAAGQRLQTVDTSYPSQSSDRGVFGFGSAPQSPATPMGPAVGNTGLWFECDSCCFFFCLFFFRMKPTSFSNFFLSSLFVVVPEERAASVDCCIVGATLARWTAETMLYTDLNSALGSQHSSSTPVTIKTINFHRHLFFSLIYLLFLVYNFVAVNRSCATLIGLFLVVAMGYVCICVHFGAAASFELTSGTAAPSLAIGRRYLPGSFPLFPCCTLTNNAPPYDGRSAPRLQLFVCPPGSSGEELVPVTSDALPLRALTAAQRGFLGFSHGGLCGPGTGPSPEEQNPAGGRAAGAAPSRGTKRTIVWRFLIRRRGSDGGSSDECGLVRGIGCRRVAAFSSSSRRSEMPLIMIHLCMLLQLSYRALLCRVLVFYALLLSHLFYCYLFAFGRIRLHIAKKLIPKYPKVPFSPPFLLPLLRFSFLWLCDKRSSTVVVASFTRLHSLYSPPLFFSVFLKKLIIYIELRTTYHLSHIPVVVFFIYTGSFLLCVLSHQVWQLHKRQRAGSAYIFHRLGRLAYGLSAALPPGFMFTPREGDECLCDAVRVSCTPCSRLDAAAPGHGPAVEVEVPADGDVASLRAAVAAELRLGECCGGSAPRLQLFVCPPGSSGEELVPVTSDALPLRALTAATASPAAVLEVYYTAEAEPAFGYTYYPTTTKKPVSKSVYYGIIGAGVAICIGCFIFVMVRRCQKKRTTQQAQAQQPDQQPGPGVNGFNNDATYYPNQNPYAGNPNGGPAAGVGYGAPPPPVSGPPGQYNYEGSYSPNLGGAYGDAGAGYNGPGGYYGHYSGNEGGYQPPSHPPPPPPSGQQWSGFVCVLRWKAFPDMRASGLSFVASLRRALIAARLLGLVPESIDSSCWLKANRVSLWHQLTSRAQVVMKTQYVPYDPNAQASVSPFRFYFYTIKDLSRWVLCPVKPYNRESYFAFWTYRRKQKLSGQSRRNCFFHSSLPTNSAMYCDDGSWISWGSCSTSTMPPTSQTWQIMRIVIIVISVVFAAGVFTFILVRRWRRKRIESNPQASPGDTGGPTAPPPPVYETTQYYNVPSQGAGSSPVMGTAYGAPRPPANYYYGEQDPYAYPYAPPPQSYGQPPPPPPHGPYGQGNAYGFYAHPSADTEPVYGNAHRPHGPDEPFMVSLILVASSTAVPSKGSSNNDFRRYYFYMLVIPAALVVLSLMAFGTYRLMKHFEKKMDAEELASQQRRRDERRRNRERAAAIRNSERLGLDLVTGVALQEGSPVLGHVPSYPPSPGPGPGPGSPRPPSGGPSPRRRRNPYDAAEEAPYGVAAYQRGESASDANLLTSRSNSDAADTPLLMPAGPGPRPRHSPDCDSMELNMH
eukprot:gene2072-1253_t